MLPTSRLGRLARLAAIGARAGVGRLGSGEGAALAAAQTLGTMRGLALKLGQMASYVDGVVPEGQRDAYERAMKTLRDAAPAMSPEASARVVEEELGAPPRELFAEWADVPFASASIGQVHRACLADGRAVAVKVQHEGVARAVSADLKNAGMMGAFMGPFAGKLAVKSYLTEARARFEEELDYRHEAARQNAFAAHFAAAHRPTRDAARVRIPAVIAERSARRVLTSELAEGVSFDAACAAPEAERTAWAETLWRFVFGALLGAGLFNADPHPGNYVFAPGGVVWFLDFGCTRTLPPARLEQVRDAHRSGAFEGDADALFETACAMFDVPEDATEQRRMLRTYMASAFAPILARAPYRITRPFAAMLFDDAIANTKDLALSTRHKLVPIPAEWLFFNRLQLGFYSVLARLDVAVDYAAIEREIMGGDA